MDTPALPAPPADSPLSISVPPSRWPRRLRRAALLASALPPLLLNAAYLLVGDATPWGEFLTIWPSLLWLLGFVPLWLLTWDRKSPRSFLAVAALLAAFLLSTVEWRSLLRGAPSPSLPPRSTATRALPLCLVTWNVAGGSGGNSAILAALQLQFPDLCFLQETPPAKATLTTATLTGYWAGFHWHDAGDCGILSRHPFRLAETATVGPWSDPLAVLVDLASSRTLLAVDVRLMLPSLTLNPFPASARRRLADDNAARRAQFPTLAALIARLQARHRPDATVLAGDFNTPGGAASTHPLRAILRDAWPIAGRGWGATMTRDFPVSRIDQCWVSPQLQVHDAFVVAGPVSDHRMLAIQLALP